jgi:hypothetical protein
MARTNYQFDDEKIARLVELELDTHGQTLETEVLFDAPVENGGEQQATIRVTRSYRLSAAQATKALTGSM